MAGDNPMHHRQAHARALPYAFGREERLENAFHDFRCHAMTSILYGQAHVRTRPEFWMHGGKGCVYFDGL